MKDFAGATRLKPIAALFLIGMLSACSPLPDNTAGVATQEPLVVFLVRHAEKVDSSADPELSVAGRERAATLAVTLRSARIENIHSSDFLRTKNTAAPIAAMLGLKVQLYDPRDLPGLARQLRKAAGRHLVVGHSNTTGELAELLGGDAAGEIDEAGEYDRLYVVTVGQDGTASSALMRYGKPYAAGSD